MKFVCDRCQTRYSIADERVRQKILRIRCKTCGGVIVVQGEHASPPVGGASAQGATRSEHQAMAQAAAASAPKAVPSSAPRVGPSSAPKSALSNPPKVVPGSAPKAATSSVPKVTSSSAPTAAPSSVPKSAPASPPKGVVGGPPPPPPAYASVPDSLGGRAEWYLAIAGVRSGPFMRAEAAQRILAVDPGESVHVWKDGMSGWKSSEEVSVIARELSLLRRPAEPPPLPPPPKAAPVALPVGPLKVAAMPAAAGKAAKAPESQPASLFPGKPPKAVPESISDALDFVVDPDPGAFSDIATDKVKNIHDLANEPDNGSFADVTTKRGKSLRDLEAGPRFTSAPALSKSGKTPPPAHPLSPRANKVAERGAASSSSANLPRAVPSSPFNPRPAAPASPFNLPAAAPVVSFTSPGIGGAATRSPALPGVPAVSSNSSELGGFAQVMQAVADSDQVTEPQQAFPELISPPMDAAFPVPISADAGGAKGLGRPGLKFLVAACVIVGLVILVVMVTLRMDSRKVPDLEPAPSPEPAAEPEPKPTVDEPPKPEPVAEEKSGQGTRTASKRGPGKSVHHMDVGPAPERHPTKTQLAKPALAARPNPFDEAKTVSQSQISAVVRKKANQDGLKACYERALKMDNHLTSGRVDVTVSIAASGVVQRVVINAPASFILIEPCIKNAVKRWVFPPSAEEYGTNFPLIMQGGM
jgi:predicted Zn finger-like uncharacterized protein